MEVPVFQADLICLLILARKGEGMGEGLFQPLHILLIVGIALLLFGPSKFADLGKGLGEGIRNFKSAVKEGDEKKDAEKKS